VFQRTSTYRKGSQRQVLGEAGELVVRDRLQAVAPDGFTVTRCETESDDAQTAIDNSKNGDLFVRDDYGVLQFSVEVKTSMDRPNVTISESELTSSEAKYLIGVTTAGLWACTMEDARKVAKQMHGPTGSFWIIFRDRIKPLPIKDLFK
jgi:hypothetical protein